MKFFHLSDLHLGKRLSEFSLVEDQRHILEQILELAARERPDAALIAGDVYDKPVPLEEAVHLFDDFLYRLGELCPHIFIISGNHDSPERLAFGSRMLARGGLYISPVFDRRARRVTLSDEFGEVEVYMLPFFKPVHARRVYDDASLDTYTAAVRRAVDEMRVSGDRRNILITHQFVAGATRCESEEMSVGGSDAVSADVFDCFDYVALGHLHQPQSVGREGVRYCGSPLKYSFSEATRAKSVTVVELREKGKLELRTLPLTPLRDMRELRGSYMQLVDRRFYENINTSDYIHIILTDEDDVPEALGRLRAVYPNIMKLDYDNSRTRAAGVDPLSIPTAESVDPLDLFGGFYEQQNGRELDPEQRTFVGSLIEEIWRG